MTERSALFIQQMIECQKPLDPDMVLLDEHDGTKRLKHQAVRLLLTEIFGQHAWGSESLSLRCISSKQDEKTGLTVIIYETRVRLRVQFDGCPPTFYDGIGIWDGTQRQVKRGVLESVVQAHHNVANAADSAAFLRAALSLGPRFGGTLHMDNPYDPSNIRRTLVLPPDVTVPTPRHSDDDQAAAEYSEEQDTKTDGTDEYHHQPDQDPETAGY